MESTKKQPGLISDFFFCKITEYKVNTQKSVVLPCTSNV